MLQPIESKLYFHSGLRVNQSRARLTWWMNLLQLLRGHACENQALGAFAELLRSLLVSRDPSDKLTDV